MVKLSIRLAARALGFLAFTVYAHNELFISQTSFKLSIPSASIQSKRSNQKYAAPMSLSDLVRSDEALAKYSCPIGTSPILDTILHDDHGRRIPKMIHMTSKTRCATIEVIENINQWRLAGHSLYFHDDAAVQRLTDHPITQQLFPMLNETLKCVTNGMTKADLWRYLVLFVYGGIYADIDSRPNQFNTTTITDKDDFFGVLDSLGILAQYFLASSPRHPLMMLTLEEAQHRLRRTDNVMKNQPSMTTGPLALKVGFIKFMYNTTKGYILEGKYGGINGRTVTVKGSKYHPQDIIQREGLVGPKKTKYYRTLGIEHFHTTAQRYPKKGAISCAEHLKRTVGSNKVANYTFDGSKYIEAEMFDSVSI